MRGSVVLVHGAWSWPEDWRWVAEDFGTKDVEVRAVDLPSHHSSSAKRADDVALVEQTIAEMPDPVVAVGWSYGGAVISDIDTDNLNVVRLVYVASTPAMEAGDDVPRGGELDLSLFVFPDEHSIVLNNETWLSERGLTFPAEVLEHLAQYPRRPIALAALLAPQSRYAWQSVPSTILLGRDDLLHPEANQHWAQAHFDDVRILDGCDHFPVFRQPGAVAETVLEAFAHTT
jgi:pimeloyl-ACP methyl ester carboxylesterase